LVNKPSIILADEPTGNLDSKSGLEILKFFDQLHKAGNTLIVVTHEKSIAKRAKRRVELFDGKITLDE
jgi:putative ABC transport system ATP-binding protein